MTYRIFKAETSDGLSKLINDMLRQGWQVQGGVVNHKGVWCQAMTRDSL